MKDLIEGRVTWSCIHKKIWPPFKIKRWGDSTNARRNGVGEHTYEQLKVWERVCGLTEMGDKCKTCQCVEREEEPLQRLGVRHQSPSIRRLLPSNRAVEEARSAYVTALENEGVSEAVIAKEIAALKKRD